jgi:hypothetical protein
MAAKSMLAAVIALAFTSPAWGIGGITTTGSLPRDTSRGYFDLSVTVKDVLPSDLALKSKETSLTQRLSLYLTDVSSSETVGTNTAGTATVAFYLEFRDDVLSELNSSGNYNLTFYPRIRQVNTNGLQNLVDSSTDKKSLKVRIKYLEDLVAKGDPVDNTIVVNPTVANEAPASLAVLASHKLLSVAFDSKSSIAFIGASDAASTDAPTDATVVAFRLGTTFPSLPAKIFTPAAATDTDTTCEFDATQADGGSCIVCSDSKAYLDVASLATLDPENISVRSASKGARDISGLENDVNYAVVAMYQPDGIQRSACLTATPSENLTLTELNGEGEAKEQNFRCFVATAAYGSPLHKNLRGLRWFRDGIAGMHPAGNALIEAYYRLSPPLAAWISKHPMAAASVRAALWAPALVTGATMTAARQIGLTPSQSIAGLTFVLILALTVIAISAQKNHSRRVRSTPR